MFRRTISAQTRDILAKEYNPRSPFEWRFLFWLLQRTTQENKDVVIKGGMLAKMNEQQGKYHSRNFIAKDILDNFKLIPISYDYRLKDADIDMLDGWKESGIKKEIFLTELPNWPSHILEAMTADRQIKENRVMLEDGTPYTKNKRYQIRTTEQLDALALMDKNGVVPATQLLQYMNNLPGTAFRRLYSNFDYAREVAKLESEPILVGDMLDAIQEQIQPFYKKSYASTRIFGNTADITYLPRHTRKAFTRGWYECDLRNAQLAITAKAWGIEPIEKYLREYGSVWEGLLNWMEWEYTEDNKAILKPAVYSVCFGTTKRGMCQSKGAFPNDPVSRGRFLANPLIKALWDAREIQLATIKENGGGKNYFGNWLRVKDFEKGARSVLAQIVQSWELAILRPVVDFAFKNRDLLTITIWQHDGFTVSVDKHPDLILGKLKDLVGASAMADGVVTELEISKNE